MSASIEAPRRQLWATPVRIEDHQVDCSAVEQRLRSDGPRDLTYPIVALLAKPRTAGGGFEMVVVAEHGVGTR